MVKLLNVDSASNADIQSSDSDTILTLNNSSGRALAANKIDVDTDILAASATVTGLKVRGASVASGAVMSLTGDAAYSLATIDSTEGGVAGTYGVRVALPDGTFGWLPIYPDAAVTADAVA